MADKTLPEVIDIVTKTTTNLLHQRDLVSLLLVSPWLNRTLSSNSSLWKVIDLREKENSGERLISALSLSRYLYINMINMEFSQGFEDTHCDILKTKCVEALQNLEALNLNGCQKITDKGIQAVTSACPNLKGFSIYWNMRVTDVGIMELTGNCKHVVDLNLSGCKHITDKSLNLIADIYPNIKKLNLTRCIHLTDDGLKQIMLKCSYLESLNLYALSSFTDTAYKNMSLLSNLKFLDLCGSQNLTDDGLSCISKCKKLVSLNLTWCVRVTDIGVLAIAHDCTSLEFLSLFGIVGVTDKSLLSLSKSCSNTLTTLDVNGCIRIKGRSREELLALFPRLVCFNVHS